MFATKLFTYYIFELVFWCINDRNARYVDTFESYGKQAIEPRYQKNFLLCITVESVF